jgi:hypothetical protein
LRSTRRCAAFMLPGWDMGWRKPYARAGGEGRDGWCLTSGKFLTPMAGAGSLRRVARPRHIQPRPYPQQQPYKPHLRTEIAIKNSAVCLRTFSIEATKSTAVTNGRSGSEPVVITGAALGLPGTEHIFDDGNIARILHGDQLIDFDPLAIPPRHARQTHHTPGEKREWRTQI